MSILDRAILERHSTRIFLPTPVAPEVLDEALALAQARTVATSFSHSPATPPMRPPTPSSLISVAKKGTSR
jgi:hypothetical protein